MLRRVVWYKFIDALIALMMEAVSTSETSVSFYQTTLRYIPEDSHFHTRRHENLISHQECFVLHHS
jgi:hypothetical protein